MSLYQKLSYCSKFCAIKSYCIKSVFNHMKQHLCEIIMLNSLSRCLVYVIVLWPFRFNRNVLLKSFVCLIRNWNNSLMSKNHLTISLYYLVFISIINLRKLSIEFPILSINKSVKIYWIVLSYWVWIIEWVIERLIIDSSNVPLQIIDCYYAPKEK